MIKKIIRYQVDTGDIFENVEQARRENAQNVGKECLSMSEFRYVLADFSYHQTAVRETVDMLLKYKSMIERIFEAYDQVIML